MPRSRLMATLDAAIAAAANPVEAKCLRAERAGLLARQGQLEAAKNVIDELNAQLAWQPSTPLRAWVALAEGLHGYYSTLGLEAQTSIEQAYMLARDQGALKRLHALAAGWLAHMAYAHEDMARAATLVREALNVALPEHRGARARAALVAGYAYHYAAGNTRAQPWYEASRRHAIAEGDEAHLSALMHNQAALRASQARLALLFDATGDHAAQSDAVSHALLGAESIGHYDAGIGTASLGSLVPMLRAQVLTAQGRWAEALALFETHFDLALSDGLTRYSACLLADRAWCEWHSGAARKAKVLAAAAEQALTQPCDSDDCAIAHARLAQVSDVLGDAAAAQRHRDAAQTHYTAHRHEQRGVLALLDQALDGLDPARV